MPVSDLYRKASPSILLALVFLALWLPRGLALDRFVTVDEPKWLVRSANFYQAIARGDFGGTFQREHPGVTITWAGMAGLLWRFPGYFKIAPGQLASPADFDQVLGRYEKSPLALLVAGRTFVVLAIVAALGLAYLYAARLLGFLPALFAFLIVAFDPFSIALSRLLHLDGLLSALMLLALLTFSCYLFHGRRRFDLIVSALAAGLACLTKSPAFFLAPFFGLLLLIHGLLTYWTLTGKSAATMGIAMRQIWRTFSLLLLWSVVAAAVFTLLWPAMWVDPLGSLGRVFSTAITYAAEGHERGNFFNGAIYADGNLPWTFYPVAYVWRATPIALCGLVLAVLALVAGRRLELPRERLRLMAILILFALLFTVFISLGAKKFDRYLLPVFAPLDLVAGLGWFTLMEGLYQRLSRPVSAAWRNLGAFSLVGAFLLIHLTGVLQTFPYYLNYYNPLLGGSRRAASIMMVGWGEGLDQAARYLNSISIAKGVRVLSWYGEGCFSYFYAGATDTFGDDYAYTNLRSTDYVVLYVNEWQRRLPGEKFLDIFQRLSPEHVVRIGGIEYARIYNLQDAPTQPAPSSTKIVRQPW